ncbi:DNA primase [Brevibacterium linens]|uniref:DNA primase n=1 Tax=Brevibacterium linens ATCC 9172 TaxID=1255617 RepID=A0A2H1HJ60_BRELN|nr:DNA primase [Brevibacterium linens]AZU00980.1 DNA primase [Brevibacterium linens]KAB1949506.1 DNA primase [Brevibacterium linens ATCC 9172]SMX62962.1 DNA primase [Brevibacterium linens ATCC 9172]
MAGLIKREDIDELRSRTRIDEVIGEFVTLKTAGIGSLKGLCPFHDEKTPSFTVRPQVGMYHCFGCGESGDVFTFLQKVEQLSFVEAVETLAGKAGMHLRYEDGKGPDREQASRRQRLLEMHEVAGRFFAQALESEAGQIGREFLTGRGFPAESSRVFGIGFAPKSWDGLTTHLRRAGFTDEEILAGGLASEGGRGIYDRFRGRVIWPIKDMTARTIGFGARRLYDDDKGPKYLNTPETALYHKNQVLYGLDLAKKSIAKTKRVVVVEGYTDVMAAHLAGVDQAVATCGTAFGAEHVKIIRRLLGDDPTGQVIFTFDGDAAGQKAALKAFEFESLFSAQTFVAVEPDGLDPCDLRMRKGDAALRELIDGCKPLFEFVITTAIARFDLDTVEGRISAVRAAAEVLTDVRDRNSLSHYYRFVAGRIGVDIDEVEAAVRTAARQPKQNRRPAEAPARQSSYRDGPPPTPTAPAPSTSAVPGSGSGSGAGTGPGHAPSGGAREPGPASAGEASDERGLEYVYEERPDVSNLSAPISPARLKTEKGALMVALQHPEVVNAKLFDSLSAKAFEHPGYRRIQDAIGQAGGLGAAGPAQSKWAERVLDAAAEDLRPYVAQLLVTPLPVIEGDGIDRFARGIVARLFDYDLERIAKELHSRLQRQDTADGAGQAALLGQLQTLEQHRARLRTLM